VSDHGDHDLAVGVGAALLDQAFDRDAGVAHGGRDLGEDAGAVGHDEAHVAAAAAVTRFGRGELFEFGHRDGERCANLAAGNVDEVGDNSARGRPVAGAGALEQQAAGEIALGDDCIGCPVNMGERTFELMYLKNVHSEADTAVWLPKERVLFSASGIVVDQINILRPFVTIPDILAAAKMMKALNPEHVIPGHGQPGTVKIFEDTEKYYALLL